MSKEVFALLQHWIEVIITGSLTQPASSSHLQPQLSQGQHSSRG